MKNNSAGYWRVIQKKHLSQQKDEKREASSGVQAEKLKSKEIVIEMSQGADYRTGEEDIDVWNEKFFAESLVKDLG